MKNLLIIAAVVALIVVYMRSKNAAAAPKPTYTLPNGVTLPLVQGTLQPVTMPDNPFVIH